MYVWRLAVHVKTGCMQELMSLVREPYEEMGGTFLIPVTGCGEVLEVNFETEEIGNWEQEFANMTQSRTTLPKDEMTAKFDKLITSVTWTILSKL